MPVVMVITLLLSLTISVSVFAQIEFGSIKGTVVEEGTGRPLTGTNIVVLDTRLGAATDRDGNFEIH